MGGFVKAVGHDAIHAQLITHRSGNGLCGGDLHLLVDLAGAHIQCAAENTGEGQHIVDLVGEVTAAGADDVGAALACLFGHDLGGGVGHSQHDGLVGHMAHILSGDAAGNGHTDEHIGAVHGIAQLAADVTGIGDLSQRSLLVVHGGVALVQQPLAVGQNDVPHALTHQQTGDGQRGSTCAADDHLQVFHLLFSELAGIDQCGRYHHGGTVLVVVEDGNVAALLQSALDLDAAGGGDVLQIDAAKAAGDQFHGADDLIHILAADAEGEGIHIAEGLEQGTLALHHRHTGLGADVTQPQHSGTVSDDGHQIAAAGVGIAQVHIVADLQAGLGNTGGVGDAQLFAVGDGALGGDGQLALPFFMGQQRLFFDIHRKRISLCMVFTCGRWQPWQRARCEQRSGQNARAGRPRCQPRRTDPRYQPSRWGRERYGSGRRQQRCPDRR